MNQIQLTVEGDLADFIMKLAESCHKNPAEAALGLLRMAILLPGNTSMQTWFKLTTRQQQVVSLVCLGMTNRQVAEELTLSENTVKVHIKEAMRKFEVSSRSQLCAILEQSGLDMGCVYAVLCWNINGDFPKLTANNQGFNQK